MFFSRRYAFFNADHQQFKASQLALACQRTDGFLLCDPGKSPRTPTIHMPIGTISCCFSRDSRRKGFYWIQARLIYLQYRKSGMSPQQAGEVADEDLYPETTGINSMRFPNSTTCIRWPGFRRMLLRMRLGMTTWNFGDIFTASITVSPYRYNKCITIVLSI